MGDCPRAAKLITTGAAFNEAPRTIPFLMIFGPERQGTSGRFRFVCAGCLALTLLLAAAWTASAQSNRGRGAASVAQPTPASHEICQELEIGAWIWTTNFEDKQTCRLWRGFVIPHGKKISRAILKVSADNGYSIFLNGREIGRGGDWRYLTCYDITGLLSSGKQTLAVEGLNDVLEGGVILGLRIDFAGGGDLRIVSDKSWRVVPNDYKRWTQRTEPDPRWPWALEVGVPGQTPWWLRPNGIISAPALEPVVLRFWQRGWFLTLLTTVCVVALAFSIRLAGRLAVQNRAQQMLGLERTRIARDIHDDLGAGLTQLTLQGELALRELPAQSGLHERMDALCTKARSLLDTLDEVVWAVNSRRDTVQEFVSFICKHAESFLEGAAIHCRLDISTELPAVPLDLPVRRNLLLGVKEALRNAGKHSHATELFLRIRASEQFLEVVVEDNGRGFDPATAGDGRNGMGNMAERMTLIGGEFCVATMPGAGCRVVFRAPIETRHREGSRWRAWLGGKQKGRGVA